MKAKTWVVLLVAAVVPAPARAQESTTTLKRPGLFRKFLTPTQTDRWLFEGDKGETIIAHVSSREFDPILELARPGKTEDKVLLSVDDPGLESRFAVRLPEKGAYMIRVHAYKYQGGGNYALQVQRFRARPLAIGKRLVGTFDRTGKSYHHFQAAKDQALVPELKGAPAEAWHVLDFKGRQMPEWAGTVTFEAPGDAYLIASGQPGARYELLVRQARQRALPAGKDAAGAFQQGEMDVWSFQGAPGDFRLLEVEKKGEVLARTIFAPAERRSDERVLGPGERPEVTFLPVASRGGRLRFAAVLGREGRYQLQLLARSPASYKLTVRDPSVPLEWGKEAEGKLPVGGAAFYTFKAAPGQLFQAGLSSTDFVPVLRLTDRHGALVASSGAEGDALEAHVTHMVLTGGLYRLEVSSLGDGGGGSFRLALRETKLKELELGKRGKGTLQPGATDFWSFQGKEGQTVFLSARSGSFEPTVSLRSPSGVLLAADNRGNPATGSLLAVKLPRSGRYTVWVSSRRGSGEYVVRLLDGD
jgi:hypothetical protein